MKRYSYFPSSLLFSMLPVTFNDSRKDLFLYFFGALVHLSDDNHRLSPIQPFLFPMLYLLSWSQTNPITVRLV